jgi:hypothetical protein
MRAKQDVFTRDYEAETRRDLARVMVSMFLCGPGKTEARRGAKRKAREDIRSFLRKRIYEEFVQCEVKLGEHEGLIRAFSRAAGKTAANLADHELSLAATKRMDLVVIFPCSPGSFAELGMFCMAKKIAPKMVVFFDRQYKNRKSYVRHGPIEAARLRKARIFYVDYADRNRIWTRVRDIVQQQKEIKRGAKIFAE